MAERTIIETPTGAALNAYVRKAEAEPCGVVQINHGLAEHAGRYDRFQTFLAARGFHSVAHDHRGHGLTQAPDAPLGRFAAKDGIRTVLADVAAVHRFAAGEFPGLPVILFGHSMGGLIAMAFLLEHRPDIRGAAIWNANFSAGFMGRVAQAILAWEKLRLGSDVPSRMLPRLTFQEWGRKIAGARTPFDWLSRDAAEVDRYIADPLCGWGASVSMWQDVFRLVFLGADDRNYAGLPRDLPFHLVGGAEDPATEGGKAVDALAARLKRMGFSNLVSTVYAQTRHESLNELNRDMIALDFGDWAGKLCRRHRR